jgi:hypothetical protein
MQIRALAACFTMALLATATPPASASETENATIVLDGIEWAVQTNGAYVPWPAAVRYCDQLELAGHSDWRLPSLSELESLYDAEAAASIREPFRTDACCLWSGESLVDRPAEDMEEIAGQPDMYHWGYMFDGAQRYYAVHIFEDGQALCARDPD